MRKVILLAMILLLAPISSFGASNFIGVVEMKSETFDIVSDTKQVLQLHFSNPYVEEWRSIRDTLNIPSIDFRMEERSKSVTSSNRLFKTITFGNLESQEICDCSDLSRIFIDGNDDFKQFPGSGTEDDPYIIENYTFKGADLVVIQNTDAHFELRFMSLLGNFRGLGISLDNVTNGNIHDNHLTNHRQNILIRNSNNIVVANNVIDGGKFGIHVVNSYEILLLNNDITNTGTGIKIENSQSIDAIDNYISNSNTGLHATISTFPDVDLGSTYEINSTDISVINNTISDNFSDGVLFQSTTLSHVIGNTLAYNGRESGDGIVLINSHNNVIKLNDVFATGINRVENLIQIEAVEDEKLEVHAGFGGVGIFLDPSFNNTIEQNDVYDNSMFGVYIQESNKTLIAGNLIYENGFTGLFIQNSDYNEIRSNTVNRNGFSSELKSLATNDLELIAYAGFGGVGIFLDPSVGNIVEGNFVNDNFGNGIALEYSSNTTISNNNVNRNGLSGVSLLDSDHNIISHNAVTESGQILQSLSIMSKASPLEMKALAGFGGVGIFLDPSVGNVVKGNHIMGNVGMGTYLEESSDTLIQDNQIIANGEDGVVLINSSRNKINGNTIDSNGLSSSISIKSESMNLYAGFGGVGIFLDPSPDNEISNNSISNNHASGVYLLESNSTLVNSNNVTENGAHGLFLQNSSHNNLTGNHIDQNGKILAQVGLSLSAGFGGVGIFLDPSWYNVIEHNNVSSNSGEGLFLEGSHFTEIELNVFIANIGYGVSIDNNSTNANTLHNDFFENGGESSQALDNGTENIFLGNFWSDHEDPSQPYPIDGSANNFDQEPAATPNIKDTPIIEVEMDFKPDAINAISRGRYVKTKITLPMGYKVVSIQLGTLFLNETINPIAYSIHDGNEDDEENKKQRKGKKNKNSDDGDEDEEAHLSKFTLYFYRRDVNDLVNSLDKPSKFLATLEITGTINSGELGIHGTDVIKVVKTIHDQFWLLWFLWWLFRHLGIFGGVIALKPLKNKLSIPESK